MAKSVEIVAYQQTCLSCLNRQLCSFRGHPYSVDGRCLAKTFQRAQRLAQVFQVDTGDVKIMLPRAVAGSR